MSGYGYSPYGAPPMHPYGYPQQYQPYGMQPQMMPPPMQPQQPMPQAMQPMQPQMQPQMQQQQQPAGIPYIGALISLVSKMDLRYEGTLYTIDPKNSTVALKDVRCFGTEDRVVDPTAYVPPSPSIYEFIVFSGRDIKDLHVIERSNPQQLHEQEIVEHQDETHQIEQQDASQNQEHDQPLETEQHVQPQHVEEHEPVITELESSVATISLNENKPRPSGRTYGRGGHRNQSNNQSNNQAAPRYTVSILEEAHEQSTNAPQSNNQQHHHHNRRRHHNQSNNQTQRQPQQNNEEILAREFDFESSNARFNKDEFIQSEIANSGPTVDAPVYEMPVADDRQTSETDGVVPPPHGAAAVIGPKYDKSKSFFDDLGSSDRGGRSRGTNQVDRETFGDSALRGGYRGRGHYNNRNRRGGNQGYNQSNNNDHQGFRNDQRNNQGYNQNNSGFPQRDNGGFPQRDNGGFPQRDNRSRGGRGGGGYNRQRNWSDLVNGGQDGQ